MVLAKSSGDFEVDYVRNDGDMKTKMTLESLKKLDGVIFANTTGDLPKSPLLFANCPKTFSAVGMDP